MAGNWAACGVLLVLLLSTAMATPMDVLRRRAAALQQRGVVFAGGFGMNDQLDVHCTEITTLAFTVRANQQSNFSCTGEASMAAWPRRAPRADAVLAGSQVALKSKQRAKSWRCVLPACTAVPTRPGASPSAQSATSTATTVTSLASATPATEMRRCSATTRTSVCGRTP